MASKALRFAANNGHAECVKLLIPVSDPKADGSLALRSAARHGNTECLKLLIPVSPPLIEIAIAKGQSELAALLLSVVEQQSIAASLGGRGSCIGIAPLP